MPALKLTTGLLTLALALFIFQGCRKNDPQPDPVEVSIDELVTGGADSISAKVNPSGIAPLTALAKFNIQEPVFVAVEIPDAPELEVEFALDGSDQELPILGLLAGMENEVILTFTSADRMRFARHSLKLKTDSLPEYFPEIRIDKLERSSMEPGWHLSDLHFGVGAKFHSRPIIFDDQGRIRWYLDLSGFGSISWPMSRLQNGNLCFGNIQTIYEYDMLGRQVNFWTLPSNFTVHHEVREMPNGNFLAAVNNKNAYITVNGQSYRTVEDHLLEIDRQSGAVVTTWDMRQFLDVDRHDLVLDYNDWFHMNSVWYSEEDDCLIISGRNQGIVKVNRQNELIWILSPHLGWGKSGPDGTGPETTPFLLTAVDANGSAYSQNVQYGTQNTADFDWVWGQHAPLLLPNGNLFVFDNGFGRSFGGPDIYSSGNEYVIDETNKKVQMVWQYGRERGDEYYSPIISDVDHLPQTSNRLIMPGIIQGTDGPQAKITEVSYPDKAVVFEATILFKNLKGNGQQQWGEFDLIYRSERLSLYP